MERTNTTRRTPYTNVALTVVAALLALDVAARLAGPSSSATLSAAIAQDDPQPSESVGLVSAADQRKVMIAELRRMAKRLDSIEAKLAAGISVKVTDMPELKLPKEAGK